MRLSRNFSLRELTKSSTAERAGIDNTPKDLEHLVNMTHLAIHVLQPVRDEFGVITVNSGYRSPDLNKACLLYTSPSPRDNRVSRMPSSA